MEKEIKLLMKEFVTHDVTRFIFEKPKDFAFAPGQATEILVDEGMDWRPFTLTSSNKDLVLEFTIKVYPEHNDVTKKLYELNPGEKVKIKDVFGTIGYKDKGVFIAGGAGVTPFISILRRLRNEGKIKGNKLIFSNKTGRDVILEKEFREIFPKEDLILTLTQEDKRGEGYEYGRIDKKFLEKHIKNFKQNFYICGPPIFNKQIIKILKEKGANPEEIIFEK